MRSAIRGKYGKIKTQAMSTKNKVIEFSDLGNLSKSFANEKIVHCHGVFDVLHAGHLTYFQSAKKFGDILVVTITTDKYVNKGPGRPYFTDQIRANMVAALEAVDFVAISDHPTAVPAITTLKPHFYVKGPDYRDKTKDVTGGILEEEKAVERHGGKLLFTEDETFSSSTLVNRYFMHWSEDQLKTIEAVRELGGEETIAKVLDKVAELKVAVVGEPIVDTYRFCTPENISSKSPSISARFLYEENYAGGSLAVANHLAGFVKKVNLVITHGEESRFQDLLKEKMDKRIAIHSRALKNIPSPRKVRYIAVDNSQRIFEITDLRADQWTSHSPKPFCQMMEDVTSGCDAVVLADFGHGLFEGEVLEQAGKMKPFTALNVQTNSSNYGFNVFTKHKKFNFLSLDTREARIAYHDRISAPIDIGRSARRDVAKLEASVAMTLGPNGSYFFLGGTDKEFFSPAFTDKVIDATGAGDAFFCLASMLLKVGSPPQLIPFLGNLFAGLKTKIIGNKNAVTRSQLMKSVTSVLK